MKRIRFTTRRSANRQYVPARGEQPPPAIEETPPETRAEAEAKETPERPSTFELAQLAAILATRPDSLRISPGEVVAEAMQVWEAAAKVTQADRQEQQIWSALFTDPQEQWQQRLKTYVGGEERLQELMAEPRFEEEKEVLPRLFPGDTETAQSRREKFRELLRQAPPSSAAPPSADEGSAQKLSPALVRSLVEVQQAQQNQSPAEATAREASES